MKDDGDKLLMVGFYSLSVPTVGWSQDWPDEHRIGRSPVSSLLLSSNGLNAPKTVGVLMQECPDQAFFAFL
jgi:hypothetical protein